MKPWPRLHEWALSSRLLWVLVSSGPCLAVAPLDCPVFPAVTQLNTSTNPVAVVAGHFDRDARPDLAVLNRRPGSVTVFLNRGPRAFGAPAEYPVRADAGTMSVTELNGDGRPDLMVTAVGSFGEVTALFGQEDGSFVPQSVTGEAYLVSARPGDFNGDGRVDVVMSLGSGAAGTLSVQFNDGRGRFLSSQSSPAGSGLYYMEPADLDGDGQLDLAGADFASSSVVLYLGRGGGSFERAGSISFPQPPTFLRAADLDRDGQLDLAVSSFGFDSVWVLFGKGPALFEPPAAFVAGTNPAHFELADLNGDQRLDLICANNASEGVSILRGEGVRGFVQPGHYSVGGKPTGVAVADFDGDGAGDVAAANDRTEWSPGTVTIAWGNGRGEWDAPRQMTRDSNNSDALLVHDVNGDGRSDLILKSTHLHVWLSRGGEEFEPPVDYAIGYPTSGHQVAADFNRDGLSDFLVPTMTFGFPPFSPFNTYGFSVLLSTGPGQWESRGGALLNGEATSLAAGDLNGDGLLDVVAVRPREQRVTVLMGLSEGRFQAGEDYPAPDGVRTATLINLDGDHSPDLALHNLTETYLMVGSQNGTFRPAPTPLLPVAPAAFGDLNQDGLIDLAGVNGTYDLTIFLGQGAGGFAPAGDYPIEGTNTRAVLSDLNGDSRLDLAVESSSGATILLGAGDGSFAPHSHHPLGWNPGGLAVADFEGDGRKELVVLAGNSQRRISVLRDTCATSPPVLRIERRPSGAFLTWPRASESYQLEFSPNLRQPLWERVTQSPGTVVDRFELAIGTSSPAGYFRLRRPRP